MNFERLMRIRARWLSVFTAYPSYEKRVGLTIFTLLRLNPERPLSTEQLRLLKSALEIAVYVDLLNRVAIDDESYKISYVFSRALGFQSASHSAVLARTLSLPSRTRAAEMASIPYYNDCMRVLCTSLQTEISDQRPIDCYAFLTRTLRPLSLQQRVSILKTEQRYAALSDANRIATVNNTITDYEALINIPSTELSDEQVETFMTILERTNTFDALIKEGESALGLALQNQQENFVGAIIEHDPNLICANEFGYSPWHANSVNDEIVAMILEDNPDLLRRMTGEALCRPIQRGDLNGASMLFMFAITGEFDDHNILINLFHENPNIYTEITSEGLCRPVPHVSDTSPLYWILYNDNGIAILQELLRRNSIISVSGAALTHRRQDLLENSSALDYLLFQRMEPNDSIADDRAAIFNELCRRNPNLGREMSYDAVYIGPDDDNYNHLTIFIKRFPQFKNNVGMYLLSHFNEMANAGFPFPLTDCINLAIELENFLKSNRKNQWMMARLIWNNFEKLVNAELNSHNISPDAKENEKINEDRLYSFLRLFPQFKFLLTYNTRREMLAAYQQRDYINNVVVVLSQGARQPASPLFRLPRLVLNHIAIFASGHQHMNPQSALTIATATITEPKATANASSSSSSSAIAGTKRVIAAAKRTRNYQSF